MTLCKTDTQASVSIVCIFDDSLHAYSSYGFFYARAFAFLQAFESGCLQRNIHPVRLTKSQADRYLFDAKTCLGVVFWLTPGHASLFDDCMPHLQAFKGPVIAVDLQGDFQPQSEARRRNVFVMRQLDWLAGRAAATYLLRKGHRGLALFSTTTRNWSRDRIGGTMEAITESGCECGIRK